MDIAKSQGVDAVWPGWGHASENPKLPDGLKEPRASGDAETGRRGTLSCSRCGKARLGESFSFSSFLLLLLLFPIFGPLGVFFLVSGPRVATAHGFLGFWCPESRSCSHGRVGFGSGPC